MTSVEKRKQTVDVQNMHPPQLSELDGEDLERGIVLFNSGRYWEAHEAWEEVWKRHPEPGRIFFQGLIQVAAGMHQLQRLIYHGVEKHFRNALWKLKPFSPVCSGIDVARLVEEVSGAHHRLEQLGKRNIKRLQQSFSLKIAKTQVEGK